MIYIDHYGNALTGLRVNALKPAPRLSLGNKTLNQMRTFTDAAPTEAFIYANSNGLWEIAVRDGSAAQHLGLSIGSVLVEQI